MPSSEKPFQRRAVLLLSFSHYIHDIYTSFLAPVLPVLIEKLSISLSQAGLLSTVMQLPSLLNPFIGALADRKALSKWLLILSPTLTAVPMCMIGMATAYWVLLVLFFVAGVSVALYHVPAPGIVARVSGPKKGRGMSFFMTGGEAARMTGPLIAVGVISLGGLAGFYPLVLIAMATSVLLYRKLAPLDMSVRNRQDRPSLVATARDMGHVLVPLSGILTARAFMHSAMAVFLAVFIEKETGNLWLAGISLALYEAFGVAGVLCAGILSDTLGRKRVLAAAVIIAPVSVFLFIVCTGVLKVIMLCLAGFSILSTTPVMLAVVQEQAGDTPSAANGLFMMVSFLTRSLAIVLVGALADITSLETMYLTCSVIGLAAVPFVLRLQTRRRTADGNVG